MNYQTGVYCISNHIDGKHYIGSATDLLRRQSEHYRSLRRNAHDNPHLQNAWNKYGEETFLWRILVYCDEDNLLLYEQRILDFYRNRYGWRMLYNCDPIAGSRMGSEHSEETKAKMSKQRSGKLNAFYGRQHSEESIEKMRKSHQGQIPWNYGKSCSDDVKKKISIANTGKTGWNKGLTKETDERVRRYAEAKIGKNIWENIEHPRGMLGKNHTIESRARISKALKGRKLTKAHRRKISEAVKAAWKRKRELRAD